MPRGGSHQPDGYSPHKLSDGRVLKILKSTNSKTLYFKVVENHEGKFYPKISVTTAQGTKKYKMIGAGSPTARKAGIVLAKYEDNPWALPEAPPRKPPAPKDEEQVMHDRLDKLTAEANSLVARLYPVETRAPEAEFSEVSPGVWMVSVDATEGAAAGARSVSSEHFHM